MSEQLQQIDTKSLFAPKKGKQATKGQKQIYEGNQETIRFYSIIAVVFVAINLIFSGLSYLTVFGIIVQACSIGAMYHMAKPVLSGPSQTVVDGGIDLNLEGGFSGYFKDLIITTAACNLLSVISNKFWFLWLWLPVYYMYKIWTSFIAPWIFAPAPEGPPPEVAEKKRKKMERKMARARY